MSQVRRAQTGSRNITHVLADRLNGEDAWLSDIASEDEWKACAMSVRACQHEHTPIRGVEFSNGSKHYMRQCTNCGKKIGEYLAHEKVRAQVLTRTIDAMDNDHAGICDVAMSKVELLKESVERGANQRDYRAQTVMRGSEYQEYLLSPQWRDTRQKVLRRANGGCEGCGENRATEVHHMTYKHIGEEFLWELVAICCDCHRRAHKDKIPP